MGVGEKDINGILSAILFSDGSVFAQKNPHLAFPGLCHFLLGNSECACLNEITYVKHPAQGLASSSCALNLCSSPLPIAGSKLTCKCSIDPTANMFWLSDESTQKKGENYLNY